MTVMQALADIQTAASFSNDEIVDLSKQRGQHPSTGNNSIWLLNGAECAGADCWNAIGTRTWADGGKYVGEWRDGKATGTGTVTYPNGEKYVGEFLDFKQTEKGTYTVASEKEKERLAEEKAKEKHDRIYRACLLDKGANLDMQVPELKQAVVETCEAVAADPSWLDEWRYD